MCFGAFLQKILRNEDQYTSLTQDVKLCQTFWVTIDLPLINPQQSLLISTDAIATVSFYPVPLYPNPSSENGDDSRAESASADSNVSRSIDGGHGSPTTSRSQESRDWANRDLSSAPSSERSSAGSLECPSDRTPKCLSENISERSPRCSSERSQSPSRSRSPFRSERSCSVSPSDGHDRRGESHRFEMKSSPQGRRHSLNTLRYR